MLSAILYLVPNMTLRTEKKNMFVSYRKCSRPQKPDPSSDHNCQNLYPFSDQDGSKTIPFGAAHTYIPYIGEYPPPPGSETYIGLTENDFKTRYRNHTASFRLAKHRNSTELSKHIWTLKDNNIDHTISWRIISSSSSYKSSNKRCNLCLKEKFLIIYRPELSSLNKRNELVSSCRHRNKALLRNN